MNLFTNAGADSGNDPLGWNPSQPSTVPVRQVFLIAAAFCTAGLLASGLLALLLQSVLGWDPAVLSGNITVDSPPADIWKVRLVAGLNQLLVFLLPGLATVWALRSAAPEIGRQVSLRSWPDGRQLGFGIALLLATMPLVLYVFEWNRMLPVPEAMDAAAKKAEVTIRALLVMPTIWDFLANMLLIAIIPALGEELLFRGILQGQLMRRMRPWIAIAVAGAVFSFFHFQMDGFLPRWLLGMVLGWLYWRTQQLWIPVLAHFINNAFQIVAQYAYGDTLHAIDIETQVKVPWPAALLSVLVSLLVMRYFPNVPTRTVASDQK